MTSENNSGSNRDIGIVGAGLVGCLTALAFASKGYSVTLFELRPDPKTEKESKGLRSINLAVSSRGIRALEYVDKAMAKRVLENIIPMYGRMIHDKRGRQESQKYGLFGESINSIDRSFLNDSLLDELKNANVEVNFNHKLIRLQNLSNKPSMIFINLELSDDEKMKTFEFDYVIGTDGAHSQFRYQLQKSMRMNYSQEYIDMQYLELYIPPNKDTQSKNKFSIDPNHLHIWPRHEFMLIALPNKDGSFTSTFFSPWAVIESFKSSDEFVLFFCEQFPDATELIGEQNLKRAFENHPRGSLMQVSAFPYHNPSGRAMILGDAAHLMVPFYGQGMNCGFEDVRILMELLEMNGGDISESFKQYSSVRREDLRAICKLAMDNYYEMSTKVTSSRYLIRKGIDYYLGKYARNTFLQWIPLYSMISFRDDISYSEAIAIEKRQENILNLFRNGTLGFMAIYFIAKGLQYWDKLRRN
ncbi:uncharacterized protein PRCAT00000194001 [Priceomyces carsonii]|uniref:uncharacterized protein n=1 Tax=Priceomyces carsonii TaxID=28549 RepID=UPI002EDA12D6|nr:unnamed protein product [Priceomyces carsonii]